MAVGAILGLGSCASVNSSSPVPRADAEESVASTTKASDLSALDEDCPPDLDYNTPSTQADIVQEISVSYTLPQGFAPARDIDPSRSYPFGVLASHVSYMRSESRLYFPHGQQGDEFLGMRITVGAQPHLCEMLRWAAVRPASRPEVEELLANPSVPTEQRSVPTEMPDAPESRIAAVGDKSVVFVGEGITPHRTSVWMSDRTMVVELITQGLSILEVEDVIKSFRRS